MVLNIKGDTSAILYGQDRMSATLDAILERLHGLENNGLRELPESSPNRLYSDGQNAHDPDDSWHDCCAQEEKGHGLSGELPGSIFDRYAFGSFSILDLAICAE